MKSEFIEKYEALSDMQSGDVAVSKNRERFFICGIYYCPLKKQNIKVIHDMNNLNDQYSETRDLSQPVKILKGGDKFVFEL